MCGSIRVFLIKEMLEFSDGAFVCPKNQIFGHTPESAEKLGKASWARFFKKKKSNLLYFFNPIGTIKLSGTLDEVELAIA